MVEERRESRDAALKLEVSVRGSITNIKLSRNPGTFPQLCTHPIGSPRFPNMLLRSSLGPSELTFVSLGGMMSYRFQRTFWHSFWLEIFHGSAALFVGIEHILINSVLRVSVLGNAESPPLGPGNCWADPVICLYF